MENKFNVSQRDILRRGVRNRCPNCGAKTLFKKGLTMNANCGVCDMAFERGEGFFLGSMTMNYTVTLFLYLLPVLVLALAGVLAAETAIGLAVAGAVICPILLYRCSRSWWLMAYFYFLPHELPANRMGASPHEDEA